MIIVGMILGLCYFLFRKFRTQIYGLCFFSPIFLYYSSPFFASGTLVLPFPAGPLSLTSLFLTAMYVFYIVDEWVFDFLNSYYPFSHLYGVKGIMSIHFPSFAGVFDMFMVSATVVDAKEMCYTFKLMSAEHKRYRFVGTKIIKADKIGETGLTDTTTLFVDIFDGYDDDGHVVASGVMKVGLKDFSNQLGSMEIINIDSSMEKLKWKAKFGKFFADTIWHVYSGVSECKYLDPDSPPRKKRPLNLGNATPDVYKVVTGDNVSMNVLLQLQIK